MLLSPSRDARAVGRDMQYWSVGDCFAGMLAVVLSRMLVVSVVVMSLVLIFMMLVPMLPLLCILTALWMRLSSLPLLL